MRTGQTDAAAAAVQVSNVATTDVDASIAALGAEVKVEDGPPLEPLEYDLGTLQLEGADIAEGDEMTADELQARNQLVEVAKSLHSLGACLLCWLRVDIRNTRGCGPTGSPQDMLLQVAAFLYT
jgi:hypothetical protein